LSRSATACSAARAASTRAHSSSSASQPAAKRSCWCESAFQAQPWRCRAGACLLVGHRGPPTRQLLRQVPQALRVRVRPAQLLLCKRSRRGCPRHARRVALARAARSGADWSSKGINKLARR
jgi:hypothetical protein